MNTRPCLSLLALLAAALVPATAQERPAAAPADPNERRFEALGQRLDQLGKSIDDVLWFHRLGDAGTVDKVQLYGPPPAKPRTPTAVGAKNPLKFWSYVFVPAKLDRTKKHPLLVFPHGGVHADFGSTHAHIVRELLAQGYVVVAPDYRGSTGYGSAFYNYIDYGGLEVADNYAARNYVLENYEFVDPDRVGILGWSHGGLITLLDIFEHPGDYKVAYAGVPVSDLVLRLGYHDDAYRKIFSAPGHIGKTVAEDPDEYRRRSPIHHVAKLQTPLLIHTNTNDDDVFAIEVQALINALKAAGKQFDYEVFKALPGGHTFDRMDTRLAREIRLKIYRHLAQHLKPATPFASLDELAKASRR
jgi:dipeptidyl aminopeptidase/acylaminoacyl peptidase